MKAPHSLRHRLYLIFEFKSSQDKNIALGLSWVLTLLILINVVSVILESVPSIHAQYMLELTAFDTISVLFFTLEYCLRIWTAAERRRQPQHTSTRKRLVYMLSLHGLVDLIAILPFFLQSLVPGLDLRFLRVIRVLRILKFSHYSSALEDLSASIYSERDAFLSALYLLALSILFTACLMYYVEHGLQPDKFGTIPDAMWWSIITITTVGYGDVSPVSAAGKIIGAFTALSGVFTVALLTGIVASAFATRVRTQELEFTTEVEDVLKDGRMDAKEQRTIEHLRREFSISEVHARAIIQQIIEERSRFKNKSDAPQGKRRSRRHKPKIRDQDLD